MQEGGVLPNSSARKRRGSRVDTPCRTPIPSVSPRVAVPDGARLALSVEELLASKFCVLRPESALMLLDNTTKLLTRVRTGWVLWG